MYKKLQCVLLLLFVGSTQSQIQSTYEWLQVQPIDFQWNYELIGYATVLDNQGNVYLAGYKENGIPYGVYVLGDVFLNKYDSNGQLLFTTDLGGEGAIVNLKTDSSGNVLLLMGFLEELQVGDTLFENPSSGIRYVLLKLNSSGNLVWSYFPEIEDSLIDDCMAMTIAPNDEVYIAYGNYMDTYITKIDNSGTEISTIVQTGVSIISSLDLDNEGNLYAAGSCAEINATYNGVLSLTNLIYNWYVVKYSPTAEFQWVKYKEDITCPLP